MVKLKDIELINPLHLKLESDGHGEFPDSYKLTEEGILLLQEFGKQCFEAGVRSQYDDIKDKTITVEGFEDYLKSLEE